MENLGSFTGGTIVADNATIKEALEDLDNELSNITLTNLDINGATAGTIADASLFVIDEGADGTTEGHYVCSQLMLPVRRPLRTSLTLEPWAYRTEFPLFLVVDLASGDIES